MIHGVFIRELYWCPGVHSRRWFGDAKDDRCRNEKILQLMNGKNDRFAELISHFSLSNANGKEIYQIAVRNPFNIATEIRGKNGFGYDPILIPNQQLVISAVMRGTLSTLRGNEIISGKLTVADLTQEEKNAINNRGKIARDIAEFLRRYHD